MYYERIDGLLSMFLAFHKKKINKKKKKKKKKKGRELIDCFPALDKVYSYMLDREKWMELIAGP